MVPTEDAKSVIPMFEDCFFHILNESQSVLKLNIAAKKFYA